MNISDLLSNLEAVREDQRIICLSLDAMRNGHPAQQDLNFRSVRNIADQAEDRLACLIEQIQALEAAAQGTPTHAA